MASARQHIHEARGPSSRNRGMGHDHSSHHDVAIFGSGFAAYEIARVVSQRGQRVVVIEKGSESLPPNPDGSRVPYRREPITSGGLDFGAQVPSAFDTLPRYIGLGGTSQLWSGKWRRLDSLDLKRSYDGRRWLVGDAELASHYDMVDTTYGKPDWSCDVAFDGHSKVVEAHGLRLVEIYEEAPPLRLLPKWDLLRRQGLVDLFCDASVEEVVFDRSGDQLERIRVMTGGQERSISASDFVIACGGIESVHFSHKLRAGRRPQGDCELPTKYGGFMDHPKAIVGTVDTRQNSPLVEYLEDARSRYRRLLAFGLPERELAAANLGNHTVFLWAEGAPAAKHPMRMVINLEQFPEANNFVTRSPTPTVSWRVSRRTWMDCDAYLKTFVPRLTELLGPVTFRDDLTFRGASHHMGALPMGERGSGHVDSHCRFYDVGNLYCVSSAIFPIAGSANPTMTVVAMAHRLGDHLSATRHS
jgi:GMC oxidoreductase